MRVGLVSVLSYDTRDSADSDLALAETTLRLAEDLFRAELATADTIDGKAASLLAADVAALTIVVTFHHSLASWWWIAAIFLALSSLCFFVVLWQRDWDRLFAIAGADLEEPKNGSIEAPEVRFHEHSLIWL
jgi:hypothetical protein